jgi:RNA polymerase sigma factor (TIGR02999 family)
MPGNVEPVAPEAGRITVLLNRYSNGDRQAGDELFPVVLDELKRIAAARLRSERDGCPLQPTELVNLAYLKLADRKEQVWADRRHFFNFSSKVMHHVLVDMARRADAIKRPGKWIAIPLENDTVYTECDADEILDVARTLERLRAIDARAAQVVEHRLYGGLTNEEIAVEIQRDPRTVKRDLAFARSWILRELRQKTH